MICFATHSRNYDYYIMTLSASLNNLSSYFANALQAADLAQRFDEIRLARERGAIGAERIVEAALLAQHVGEIEMQSRVVGRQRQRGAQCRRGIVEVAELRQHEPQAAVSFGMSGCGRDRAAERVGRCGRLALIEQGRAGVERGHDEVLAQRRIVGPKRQRLGERNRRRFVATELREREREIGARRQIVRRDLERLLVMGDRLIEPARLLGLQRGVEKFASRRHDQAITYRPAAAGTSR